MSALLTTRQTRMSALPEFGDAMQEPILAITRRRLPHWTLPGSTYYVTFHLAVGELSPDERRIVLGHVRRDAADSMTWLPRA